MAILILHLVYRSIGLGFRLDVSDVKFPVQPIRIVCQGSKHGYMCHMWGRTGGAAKYHSANYIQVDAQRYPTVHLDTNELNQSAHTKLNYPLSSQVSNY